MTPQRSQDEGDWGETELDPHERADAELNLDDPSAGDDEPWSPPNRLPRGAELLGLDTGAGETLDQRIGQEQPDPGTAYGAPDGREEREAERMVGGDDPDAIPADRDVLGGEAGDDAPYDGDGPEASAMRVVEGDD
jgi:hypothetical protein